MSDKHLGIIVTSDTTYVQDEDGQGWTLVENADGFPYKHITNGEMRELFPSYFKNEKDTQVPGSLGADTLDTETLARMVEELRVLGERLHTICRETVENFRALCEQLQAGITAAEKQTQEPQRPDYKTRPKCCTRAKVKPHRKQRSRER